MYNRYKHSTTNLSKMSLDSLTRRILKASRNASLREIDRKEKEDQELKDRLRRQAIELRLKSADNQNTLEYKIENFINKYQKPEIVYEAKSKKKRKPIGVTVTDNYVIVEFKNPPEKEVKKWRTKEIYSKKHKCKILLKIAILKDGKTKLTSIWYPKDNPRAKEILRKYKEGREDFFEEVKTIVTASTRKPVIKKLIPTELLVKKEDPRSKLVKRRKAEVGATWKNLKGAIS